MLIERKVLEEHPEGTRVELVRMGAFQALPIGTKGAVKGVDYAG